MTNFEFYKEKLSEISNTGRTIAIIDGEPIAARCEDLKCKNAVDMIIVLTQV